MSQTSAFKLLENIMGALSNTVDEFNKSSALPVIAQIMTRIEGESTDGIMEITQTFLALSQKENVTHAIYGIESIINGYLKIAASPIGTEVFLKLFESLGRVCAFIALGLTLLDNVFNKNK